MWKKLVVWGVWVVFGLVVIAKLTGGSLAAPEGIEEKFYNNALDMFHELNVAYENGEMPSDQVTKWVADHVRSVEKYPADYTDKEKYVLDVFRSLTVNIGMYATYKDPELEKLIRTGRSTLAKLLGVSEDN